MLKPRVTTYAWLLNSHGSQVGDMDYFMSLSVAFSRISIVVSLSEFIEMNPSVKFFSGC